MLSCFIIILSENQNSEQHPYELNMKIKQKPGSVY
jgi:hypothetical protein